MSLLRTHRPLPPIGRSRAPNSTRYPPASSRRDRHVQSGRSGATSTCDNGAVSSPSGENLDAVDRRLVDAATDVVRLRGDGALHTVGAALLADDGSIHAAVNVFAQGGGACAELAVVAKAISEGSSRFVRIVAVGDGDRGVVEPCGVCRQLLLDYAPLVEVIVHDGDQLRRVAIADLMPLSKRSWFAPHDA